MSRSIKLRTGMLAAREVIPVPTRTLSDLLAKLLLLERPHLPELRRELERRKV